MVKEPTLAVPLLVVSTVSLLTCSRAATGPSPCFVRSCVARVGWDREFAGLLRGANDRVPGLLAANGHPRPAPSAGWSMPAPQGDTARWSSASPRPSACCPSPHQDPDHEPDRHPRLALTATRVRALERCPASDGPRRPMGLYTACATPRPLVDVPARNNVCSGQPLGIGPTSPSPSVNCHGRMGCLVPASAEEASSET